MPRPVPQPPEAGAGEPAVAAPVPPTPSVSDERVTRLEEQLAALTQRVVLLEGGAAKAKPSLFRRRPS